MKGATLGLVSAILLAGAALPGAPRAQAPAYVAAAVSDPARSAADRAQDAARKPVEMATFAGVRPGWKVADFMPGGGYFTRLFAGVVGGSGHVYAIEPAELSKNEPRTAAAVAKLAAETGHPNVTVLTEPAEAFAAPEPLDLVWIRQNYHDLHDKILGPADVAKVNAAIFRALKPGGVYLIIDHAAEAGSGLRDTETRHRIDEQAVKHEVEAAGFVLEAESSALANPADPRTALVFDPSIRGRTDQFALRFRKPGPASR
jgi:predicted methyltransferase